MHQQALYNMRWHNMINSIHIVWKFLSLQVEIKYFWNTQRLTFIWPLSLFLRDKHSFSNSSHMFHSFKLHAHLVCCGSNSLFSCFLCKPLEINGCGSDSQAMKTETCAFFLVGKGFGDYKHEFQQNLGYDTMTFQEDLRKMDLHPLAICFMLWTSGFSEISLWDIL